MCQLQGVCEPLIEDHLGTFSQVGGVEAVNIAAIAAINSRSLSWEAGRTSLLGESFSEVLVYTGWENYRLVPWREVATGLQ